MAAAQYIAGRPGRRAGLPPDGDANFAGVAAYVVGNSDANGYLGSDPAAAQAYVQGGGSVALLSYLTKNPGGLDQFLLDNPTVLVDYLISSPAVLQQYLTSSPAIVSEYLASSPAAEQAYLSANAAGIGAYLVANPSLLSAYLAGDTAARSGGLHQSDGLRPACRCRSGGSTFEAALRSRSWLRRYRRQAYLATNPTSLGTHFGEQRRGPAGVPARGLERTGALPDQQPGRPPAVHQQRLRAACGLPVREYQFIQQYLASSPTVLEQ